MLETKFDHFLQGSELNAEGMKLYNSNIAGPSPIGINLGRCSSQGGTRSLAEVKPLDQQIIEGIDRTLARKRTCDEGTVNVKDKIKD